MYTHAVVCLMLAITFGTSAFGQEETVQITFGPKKDVDPVVSPDGKHLAFSSERAGNYDIYLLTFGQSGFQQLTQSKEDDRHPCWSKDNKLIYFNSKRTGNGDLYQMEAAGGSGYLQLSDREDVEEFPVFNPKGKDLLFERYPKKVVDIKRKTTIMRASDTNDISTAQELSEGREPNYSPDGSRVVFVSRRTKNDDVWVMSSTGGAQTQLTTDTKDDEGPCVSPNGKKIVFSSKRTGNFDIWVMDVDGSNQRQLTWGPEDETQPCWSSGDYIYFVRALGDGASAIFRIKAPE